MPQLLSYTRNLIPPPINPKSPYRYLGYYPIKGTYQDKFGFVYPYVSLEPIGYALVPYTEKTETANVVPWFLSSF
jgi:hypothetical protein